MAEASASALERFLMTKFRTATPPLPPSSCSAINGNFYSTVLFRAIEAQLTLLIEVLRKKFLLQNTRSSA
ncbi:unnamed protein product [Anisakis simplex]|uniref:Uncharacterized protein n=1 Tax=Anisakis simplex TaxID=6269 RepID=A0A0M3K8Y7_ANISI|nr:unnamed protein product [Anisakis simplex]